MNISFTFKNFEASEHLKKYARRRMEKLGRFFGKAAGLEVGVVLTVDKIRNRCEVTVVGEGLHLAASEQTNDMYAAIDLVYDKLESQIKKYVSRVKELRKARGLRQEDVANLLGVTRQAVSSCSRDAWSCSCSYWSWWSWSGANTA